MQVIKLVQERVEVDLETYMASTRKEKRGRKCCTGSLLKNEKPEVELMKYRLNSNSGGVASVNESVKRKTICYDKARHCRRRNTKNITT